MRRPLFLYRLMWLDFQVILNFSIMDRDVIPVRDEKEKSKYEGKIKVRLILGYFRTYF